MDAEVRLLEVRVDALEAEVKLLKQIVSKIIDQPSPQEDDVEKLKRLLDIVGK